MKSLNIVVVFALICCLSQVSCISRAANEDGADSRSSLNACNAKPLEKPDFRAPGRRISEEKCYEYLWTIKAREESARQTEACKRFTSGTPLFNQVPAIIGGRTVLPGEYPHMGAIGWRTPEGTYTFKCGSTLISSKFVVTAAHCTRVSDRDPSVSDPVPKIIRMGVMNINGKQKLFIQRDENIVKIIVHPQYASPKKYFDIALMEFENEVPFSVSIQPACLWTKSDTTHLGVKATVTGWGVVNTSKGNLQENPDLQTAEVDIVDSKTCDELLKSRCNRLWCGVNETQICAGKLKGGVDSCQGDSGGPLQVRIQLPSSTAGAMHYVIGVTSFGVSCAMANTPGIYTRVSSFIEWIENNVWK